MSRSTPLPKPHQPAARPPAGARPVPGRTSGKRAAAGSIILLIDDDQAVLASLSRVLRMEGWQVVTAANGEEALERLGEHQPDLMITDLRMGEVSGWDLLFHESLQRPNLPIFVITALSPTIVGEADRFAAEFFQKPLDIEALVKAIHRRLEPVAPVKKP